MKLLAVLCCLSFPLAQGDKQTRHYFGPNGTVPQTLINMGTVNVKGYGDVYVITGNAGNVDKLDNGFRLHGGGGVYLAESGADIGSDPFVYWQTDLADHVWSYDIDVSNVGCKCNAAMYWVNMPGYEGGSPYPAEWGIYYCDANFVNGNWCPEYDTFEGNDQTMNVAIHTCDFVPPNEYSSCDRAGCGNNACDSIGGQYGRGRTIDTSKPYRISHGQVMDGDFMAASTHHFEQEGRTASFNACNNGDYMKWFGYDLHDIVAVFSLWHMGCDEIWLDGCTGCGDCCDLSSASVSFSNFELTHAKESHIPEVRELYAKYNP